MKRKSKLTFQRTIDFISEHIALAGLHAGDMIPPSRTLAALASVSHGTLLKALRAMKTSGILICEGTRRYRLASAPAGTPDTPKPDSAPPLKRWERIAEQITQDIRDVIFRQGEPLPPSKELQRRYAVSGKTLQKALQYCVNKQMISQLPSGRYAATAFAVRRWRPSIVLVAGSSDSTGIILGQNDELVFRELEIMCGNSGIGIEIFLQYYDVNQRGFRYRHRRTGEIHALDYLRTLNDAGILGFAFFINWHPVPSDIDAMRALLAYGKPLAILDETKELQPATWFTGSRLIRMVSAAASDEPGKIVARHLLSLGHRKVAFFSVDHQYNWSKSRFAGLTAAFAESGHFGGVVPFIFDDPDRKFLREYGEKRFGFAAVADFYRKWQQGLITVGCGEFDVALDRLLWETCGRAEQRFRLEGFFSDALADKDITAWIAVNDTTASMAKSFLKEKRVRVPADLSLISFDDSRTALVDNLTSYNFNSQAVAAAMLGFILNSRPWTDPHAQVRGFIVDRGSTGQARRGLQ